MDIGSSTDETTTNGSPLIVPPPAIKSVDSRCRHGSGTSVVIDTENGVEAESTRKLPSSRFKGVVPQPNGRWGAQIYEKHQRVWLGTFDEEQEAAKSYDIAVKRFRGRGVTEGDDFEAVFLNSHSKSEIVDMIRKHTYNDELKQSRRNYRGEKPLENRRLRPFHRGNTAAKARELLFEKEVTPSDVGKLNRLVIPKQHAEKHFPVQNVGIMTSKGLLLNFEDMEGKVWRFRYSYWKSSQSYVLTKGWSGFVKAKNLRAGDIVSFQRSPEPDKQLYIGRKDRKIASDVGVAGEESGLARAVRMVRLFGVDICCGGGGCGGRGAIDGKGSSTGKRMREMGVLGFEGTSKKQRLLDVNGAKLCLNFALV